MVSKKLFIYEKLFAYQKYKSAKIKARRYQLFFLFAMLQHIFHIGTLFIQIITGLQCSW